MAHRIQSEDAPNSTEAMPPPAKKLKPTSDEGTSVTKVKYTLKPNITPRAYQSELAQHGIEGNNCIISLPTGAGKTLIAAMIISDHLQKNPSGKVVFTVPKDHLAEQHKQRLQQYIHEIQVESITGNSEKDIHPLVSHTDVIVCTIGKLRYEICEGKLNVDWFTLMIIDECHHVIGHSDGVHVMLRYLKVKLATPQSRRLPQVVGMSASLGAGTGKSASLDRAIEHQIGISAQLDATHGVRKVERNREELSRYVNNPESHLVMHNTRSASEPFIVILKTVMDELEGMIRESPPDSKETEQYHKWVENEIQITDLNTSPETRDRRAVLSHLLKYNTALMVYIDFNSESAKEVINFADTFDLNTVTEREEVLNNKLNTLKKQIESLEMVENPLLHQLESTIYTQYLQSETKGIVFVRTIQATNFICKWIGNSDKLKSLVRVASIVSFSRGGMPKQDQQDVIVAFKRGTFNLLVSTPVLEEGLDVPDCNFIIRYLYVSNEIAHRQTVGRARAKDSNMYIIITKGSSMSYQQSQQEERTRIEEVATEHICDLSKDKALFADRISKKQDKILQFHKRYDSKMAEQKREWADLSKVELLCKHCKTEVCKGSDVCTYGNVAAPQYVVQKKDFCEKYKRMDPKYDEAEKKRNYGGMCKLYKMQCKECSSDWGTIGWWKSINKELPLLKAESFTFKYGNETRTLKQWKMAPFTVLPYDESEEPEEQGDQEAALPQSMTVSESLKNVSFSRNNEHSESLTSETQPFENQRCAVVGQFICQTSGNHLGQPCEESRSPSGDQSSGGCGSVDQLSVKLNGAEPTLKMLMSFPTLVEGMRKNLDIIQKTSLSYVKLGTFLLEDDNCDIVDSLKEKFQGDPVNITHAVYKRWISGTGRKPLTWQTLVDVLAEIELCSVADEIKRRL